MTHILFRLSLSLVIIASLSRATHAVDVSQQHSGDEHYSDAGFFDIHVCQWPKRPVFIMALFATTDYAKIKQIEVYDNNQTHLGSLNLNKYRLVMLQKPKREKRVFIRQIEIPSTSGNGWYSTKVTLKNNKVITARDYVILHKMDLATGIYPKQGTTIAAVPKKLRWKPVPGAAHYQVFIKDNWEGKSLLKSDLLSKPELTLPKGLLQPGGSYCWRIHARDVNENVLLGDFNHGSVTKCFEFDIKD